ncbi:MAG: hypothetical protein ACFFG0_17100 [Candidatus Thorarchaeota archaeon]
MEIMEEFQDYEWKNDWEIIVKIFDTIDKLKSLFKQLDVPYLREVQQKIMILNLKKYTFSLQDFFIQKYSKT